MNTPSHRTKRLLSAFASLALAPASHAALLALDFDPGTIGIQDTINALPGETVSADLIFFPDAAGISSWKFSVNFDTAELSLLGNPASTTATPPVGFVGGSIDLVDNSLGQVWGYFGQAITPGSGPTGGSIAIGTLNFTATNPATDGSADLTPGFFNPGIDGALDNLGNTLTPTFQPAYVNVVPEPASVTLLGLGSLLLATRRRRSSILPSAIISLVTVLPASAAVIIASDLNSSADNSSVESAGYWEADSFVTNGNSYQLTAGIAYIRLNSGPTDFVLGLYADDAGLPGALLGILTTGTTLTTSYQNVTFTPTSVNILLPNTTYWLGARVTIGGVDWAWTQSGVVQSGVGTVTGVFAGTTNQGASWPIGGANSPNLFQVEGIVVPEPSTFALLSLGLPALLGFRRRR